MPKTRHFAFRQDNPDLVDCLVTEAVIFTPDKTASIKARAMWDTGAMATVIKPHIAKELKLEASDLVLVSGVNKTELADIVYISVGLPNGAICDDISAMICELTPEIDILVGMDIIRHGDFAISNASGKTLFTFATPPFDDKTDLYEKALALNKE